MSFKHLIAGGIVASALASPAFALEGKLIGLGGMEIVVVWKDDDAQSEGNALIDAGILDSNPELLVPLLSCVVQTGTKAIITDAGFATHDVMVIDGEHAGCRGNVPMEAFKSN